MDALELLDLIQKGESSTVQFKVRIDKKDKKKSAYDLGTEMVAFANTKGGTLIVGVVDETGEIDGLSYEELQVTNQLLANVSTNNVKPAINIFTETVEVGEEKVIVVQVPEGISKPHTDNKGIIWVKNGSDKRTVTSREEMARLLKSSGNMFADETLINGTTINDIDDDFFKDFVEKKHGKSIDELGQSVSEL
ncbi:MAG: ATP-binding protein, partial [Bacteroidales bacterium]|nr:ATP-binding protein [Bacteroidales bacterium]